MGNHTVKKNTSTPAGIGDQIRITGTEMTQDGSKYQIGGSTIYISGITKGEYISIIAYDGGNPNKARREEQEEITH